MLWVIYMDVMKIILYVLLTLSIIFVSANAFAASKPIVRMANELYTYNMGFNNIALDSDTKKQLWQSVYNKLNDMQSKGM